MCVAYKDKRYQYKCDAARNKYGRPSLDHQPHRVDLRPGAVPDGRVKRGRNGKGQMVMRWTAAAALETERQFHKVKGHKLHSLLAAALKDQKVDVVKEVG